jgi:hypothetical protein
LNFAEVSIQLGPSSKQLTFLEAHQKREESSFNPSTSIEAGAVLGHPE